MRRFTPFKKPGVPPREQALAALGVDVKGSKGDKGSKGLDREREGAKGLDDIRLSEAEEKEMFMQQYEEEMKDAMEQSIQLEIYQDVEEVDLSEVDQERKYALERLLMKGMHARAGLLLQAEGFMQLRDFMPEVNQSATMDFQEYRFAIQALYQAHGFDVNIGSDQSINVDKDGYRIQFILRNQADFTLKTHLPMIRFMRTLLVARAGEGQIFSGLVRESFLYNDQGYEGGEYVPTQSSDVLRLIDRVVAIGGGILPSKKKIFDQG